MAKKNGNKRANGEGYVYQRENGSWRGQVMNGRDGNGKKKIKSFSGATKTEVIRKMRDFQKLKDAHIRTQDNFTFTVWADHWYLEYEDQVAPSTYAGYRYTLAILKREFGDIPIEDILPMHISVFITRLTNEGASSSKITKCRAMLVQIFDAAVDNCLILRNPARAAKRVKTRDDTTEDAENEKDAFTPEEIQALFSKLPNDILGNSIRLLIITGMRVQELLALKAGDIPEDGSSIRITRAVKTVNGKAELGGPKSKLSRRSIPIPVNYRHIAVFLKQHGSSPFLWKSGKIGKPYSVGSFRSRYYTALEKIPEVRRLPPHCCRHTYVTELQRKGISMELIAKLTGHSDISTTSNYLHVSEDTLQKTVEVLNNA